MNTFFIGWVATVSLMGAKLQHGHDHGGSSQDHDHHKPQKQIEAVVLQLPLKGVMAPCCNQAIEQAFKAVKGLLSVKVQKNGDRSAAEIRLKEGEGLPLSEVKKALDAANRSMGNSMGTKYEIDGTLSASLAHFYRTRSAPDEKGLQKALSALKGYEGVWVKKTGFAVRFSDEAAPSVEEVAKAAGIEVVEVILAPSSQGKRYACPMHPEKVSVSPEVKCPACRMKMVEVVTKP
ncbi:MAG: hypothetical protein HY716_06795 [Planctomycetes bacterium]|nr:hypothetical protein [Planctomycetota bacterium]